MAEAITSDFFPWKYFLNEDGQVAEQIHILCDLELKQAVTEAAQDDGISLSAWICRLMEEALKDLASSGESE